MADKIDSRKQTCSCEDKEDEEEEDKERLKGERREGRRVGGEGGAGYGLVLLLFQMQE